MGALIITDKQVNSNSRQTHGHLIAGHGVELPLVSHITSLETFNYTPTELVLKILRFTSRAYGGHAVAAN